MTLPATAPPLPRRVEIRHILLPIAGGASEQAAIDYATVLTVALGATITLIHVEEPPDVMVGIVPGASIDGDLAANRVKWTEWLDRVAVSLAARGVPDAKTLWLAAPNVASGLLDFARDHSVDLIVMATHARTGMPRMVLGSVAETVLRHAPCPVMTIHHPHADPPAVG